MGANINDKLRTDGTDDESSNIDKTTESFHSQRRLHLPLQISERRLLMMSGDVCAITLSILIALRLWAATANESFNLEFVGWRSIWFVILPLLWFILASANNYFNLQVTSGVLSSLSRLGRILLQLLLLYLLFFFSLPDRLPRLFILNYVLISFVFIGAWRAWQPFLLGWPGFRRRAIILGTGHAVEFISEVIREQAGKDYEIVGHVRSKDESTQTNLKFLGTGENLQKIVYQYGAIEVINAYANQLPEDVFQGIMACYEHGVSVVSMLLLYEEITGRVPIQHVGQQYWVLPLTGHTLSLRLYLIIKRVVDIGLSLVGLAALCVLLPILALFIKLDSPGPVFYRQERIGQKGKNFLIYKLRSMFIDAERDTGPLWAKQRDPRITRIGRFLRKLRLDEVPQLFNVLRGEMSLIGPRPERPQFVEQLSVQIPFYRARLAVKPGITGWAQVRYSYGSSTEDALQKLQYDLYYIRHQSIGLDLQIVMRTIGRVLLAQGR